MVTNFDMINRIGEQKFLRDFFVADGEGCKTLVLHSPSGVGKSFLVDHVISDLKLSLPYIKIGNDTGLISSSYIQQLAQALDDSAKRSSLFETLNQYLDNIKSHDKSSLGKLSGATEKAVGTLAGGGIPGISDLLASLSAGSVAVDEVLFGKGTDSIQVAERYVRHVISNNEVVLNINRYNEIDELSDRYLKNLMANSKRVFLVLEVTTETSDLTHSEFVMNFESSFSEHSINYKKIEVVNVQHILDSFNRTDGSSASGSEFNDVIRTAYSNSAGDFRKLKLLISDSLEDIGETTKLSYEDQLEQTVESMTNECKLLLAMATVIPSAINLNGVEAVWEKHALTSGYDLPSAVETIDKRYSGILGVEQNQILHRDPLLKGYLINSHLLKREMILARKLMLDHFHLENKKTNSKDTYYANLVSIIALIIQGEGSGDSAALISNLKELDLGTYPPNKSELASSMNYLYDNYILKVRKDSEVESTIRHLDLAYEETIKILYRLGYVGDVQRVFNSYSEFLPIEEHSDRLRLTVISAQILDGQKDSIIEIEKIDKSNEALYLGSRLLQMLYYRVFDEPKRSQRIWKRLFKNTNITETSFSGVFYEYGALGYPANIYKKIRMLQKARRIHTASGNSFQLASCNLGIASTFLYVPLLKKWKLKKAEKYFSSTSGNYDGVRLMDHIAENHHSMTEIYRRNTSANIIEALISAYNKCALVPDKMLIGANIVNCFLLGAERKEKVPNIGTYVHDILRLGRIYRNRKSEYHKYPTAACYRYFSYLDDEKMVREIEQNDLSFMPINFWFFKMGPPKNILTRLLVKHVLSKIYIALWPTIMPVYNWSIDFYDIDLSSISADG